MQVWDLCGRPHVDRFGDRYIQEISKKAEVDDKPNQWAKHLISIVFKFKKERIGFYIEFLRQHSILLGLPSDELTI